MRKMSSPFWKGNCFCRQCITLFLIFFVSRLTMVLLLLTKVSLITSDAYASEVRRSPRVVFAAGKYRLPDGIRGLPEKPSDRLLILAEYSRHSFWATVPNLSFSVPFNRLPFQNLVPNIKIGNRLFAHCKCKRHHILR